MRRLSYLTETVLSNKITWNIIVLSFKDSSRKPLRRTPDVEGEGDRLFREKVPPPSQRKLTATAASKAGRGVSRGIHTQVDTGEHLMGSLSATNPVALVLDLSIRQVVFCVLRSGTSDTGFVAERLPH